MLGQGALELVNSATANIVNNTEEVELKGPNRNTGFPGDPGDWVQKKIGANYHGKMIDDWRDGNATSIKTTGGNLDRTLDQISHEARSLRAHNSDWEPSSDAAGKDLPTKSIAQTRTKMLIMVIPENHQSFLRNQEFLSTVEAIHDQTDVIIHVLPLPKWRR